MGMFRQGKLKMAINMPKEANFIVNNQDFSKFHFQNGTERYQRSQNLFWGSFDTFLKDFKKV